MNIIGSRILIINKIGLSFLSFFNMNTSKDIQWTKITQIWEPDFAYNLFNNDDKEAEIFLSHRRLPDFLKSKQYLNRWFLFVNLMNWVLIWAIFFIGNLYDLWWIDIVYLFIGWILFAAISGPNARLWQIFLFGFLFYFVRNNQLLLLIFYYGIFVWSILAISHIFTQKLISKILKKDKSLFFECFENGFVIVRLKNEVYNKIITADK